MTRELGVDLAANQPDKLEQADMESGRPGRDHGLRRRSSWNRPPRSQSSSALNTLVGIEIRKTQPIDTAVAGDARHRATIADRRVPVDRPIAINATRLRQRPLYAFWSTACYLM